MENLTYTRAQNSSSVSPRKLAPSTLLLPPSAGVFYLEGLTARTLGIKISSFDSGTYSPRIINSLRFS